MHDTPHEHAFFPSGRLPALLGVVLLTLLGTAGAQAADSNRVSFPHLRTFELRYGEVARAVEQGGLPETVRREVESLRSSLEQYLTSVAYRVERLKKEAAAARGDELGPVLDQLVEAGAERERAIATHLRNLEALRAGASPRASGSVSGAFAPAGTGREPEPEGEPASGIRIEFRAEDLSTTEME